jgi:transposase
MHGIARTGFGRCRSLRVQISIISWLPKPWIVERTLAWNSRNRRLCRDYERHTQKAAAFVRLTMMRIMFRRCAANHST